MPFGKPNDYFDLHPSLPAFNQQYPPKTGAFADPLDGLTPPMTDFGAARHRLTILQPLIQRNIGDSLLDTSVSAWY